MDPVDSTRLHLAYGDSKQYREDASQAEPKDLFSFMAKKERQAFLSNAKAALKCSSTANEKRHVELGMQADDEYGVGLVSALEALKGR